MRARTTIASPSVRHPWPILIAVLVAVGISGLAVSRMGRDFLPPFDEGTVQVNVMVQPGTSLEASDRIGRMADEQLMKVPGVVTVARRTGRAELDEHAMGVNTSEIIVTIDPESGRTREQILDDIRHQLADVPGAVVSAEQPLQHLISHMLSGVQAQVAIKLYGDDLSTLRRTAKAVKAAIAAGWGSWISSKPTSPPTAASSWSKTTRRSTTRPPR